MTATATETTVFEHADLRLAVQYDDSVLVPRAWTAAQSAWARRVLAARPGARVLELCAGVGHIGQLAVLHSGHRLVCVDRDARACAYASRNAVANGLAGQVEVRCVPLAEAVRPDERYEVVVADPPWVPSADCGRFPEDPLGAIDGGPEGTAVARECVRVADAVLPAGGVLLIQLRDVEQAARLAETPEAQRLTLSEIRTPEPGRGVLARFDREGA